MKAVLIDKITQGKNVILSDIPIPEVRPGWVLVKVCAFGMNHSEQILRLSEIEENYIQKPVVPGIECVGIVENASDSTLQKGDKVIAMMGGMGRSFNGGYEEYALLPASHVFKVNSTMTWEEIAAVPETYYTAWGSLFECLQLQKEDTLLIRGATCALGYASIKIAKALGYRVLGTTHREKYLSLLTEAGVDAAILDDAPLSQKKTGATKILELIGPKTLRDSLFAVEKGGIVCHTGVLGGQYVLNGFDPIKEIPNGVYLTGFFSNYPSQTIVDDMISFMDAHNIRPDVAKLYPFDEITQACDDMDTGKVNGKIVIRVS